MEKYEQRLVGGYNSTVVRVGDTVRRPVNEWTPAVHALLMHLESCGFTGSQRVLGIDEEGREILTYAPGERPWPLKRFGILGSDDGLLRIGRFVSTLRDALETFEAPANAAWSNDMPRYGDETICHNDVGPWNLIIGPAGEFVIIDWDYAAPGDPLTDFGLTARNFVPLFPTMGDDWPYVRRLALLCELWDVPSEALMHNIVKRSRDSQDRFRARAEMGVEPASTVFNAGAGKANEAITRFIERNAEGWVKQLG